MLGASSISHEVALHIAAGVSPRINHKTQCREAAAANVDLGRGGTTFAAAVFAAQR